MRPGVLLGLAWTVVMGPLPGFLYGEGCAGALAFNSLSNNLVAQFNLCIAERDDIQAVQRAPVLVHNR